MGSAEDELIARDVKSTLMKPLHHTIDDDLIDEEKVCCYQADVRRPASKGDSFHVKRISHPQVRFGKNVLAITRQGKLSDFLFAEFISQSLGQFNGGGVGFEKSRRDVSRLIQCIPPHGIDRIGRRRNERRIDPRSMPRPNAKPSDEYDPKHDDQSSSE